MAVNKNLAVVSTVFMFFTLLLCFFTLGHFVLFLSSHTSLKYFHKYNTDFKSSWHHDGVLLPVIHNIILFGIFALQHSIQANKSVKDFLNYHGLNMLDRSLYNCGSCLSLQMLMYFWKCIPSKTLWEVSTNDHEIYWWLFTTIHFLAWLITYSGCFIMDITELLGVKQVYHYILEWPQPLDQKSVGLKRFYSHMRHPSFSAIIVILFVHPVMQLDRLLLAYAFTIYMLLRVKVDDVDYAYQRRMLRRKYHDLSVDS